MYSTIEEAWGEQTNFNTIICNSTKINENNLNTNLNTNSNTNLNTNLNTNTNSNSNLNTNTNTNSNTNTNTILNTNLNANKETFINNSEKIDEINKNKCKNNNIIQSFLIGFLIILVLQLLNNKFINNSIK